MVTTVITDAVVSPTLVQKVAVYVSEDFVIECLMKSDKIMVDLTNAEVAKWVNELLQKSGITKDKVAEITRYERELAEADYVFTFLSGVRCIIYWKEKEEVV